jgi:hypothetical protein
MERKWETRLERKLLSKKQLALDEPLDNDTLTSARRDGDDYALLRKKFDGDSGFMTHGHQIIKIRSREREIPEWTASNTEVQNLVTKTFPKLKTSKRHKKEAGRWVMVINLFYRMNLTYSQIATEMGITPKAVEMILRRINLARQK